MAPTLQFVCTALLALLLPRTSRPALLQQAGESLAALAVTLTLADP